MTSSGIPSPSFTHNTNRSQQPSISPALLPRDSRDRDRNNSYSSVSTTEYRQHRYSVSSATSPAGGFGSLPQGYAQSIHSVSGSGAGSTFTSPALLPQRDRDLDQEATAALLMLNQADRRQGGGGGGRSGSGSGTAGRGMSVRDLLST